MAFIPLVALAIAVVTAFSWPAGGQSTPPGSPVVVEGTVAMSIEDDFQSGRATRRYYLDTSGSAKRYDLRLTPRQANIVQPGMRVRLTGSLAGGILTADQADHSVVVLDTPAVVVPHKPR
jgi:hypothetical protein